MSGLIWTGPKEEEVGRWQLAGGQFRETYELRKVDAPGGQHQTSGPAGQSRVREHSDWLFFRVYITLNFVWFSFSLGASGLQASRETSNPKMISDRLPSGPSVTSSRVTAPPLINIPDNWRRSDRIYPDAPKYLLHMVQQNVQSVPITMEGKWKTAINRLNIPATSGLTWSLPSINDLRGAIHGSPT